MEVEAGLADGDDLGVTCQCIETVEADRVHVCVAVDVVGVQADCGVHGRVLLRQCYGTQRRLVVVADGDGRDAFLFCGTDDVVDVVLVDGCVKMGVGVDEADHMSLA